MKRRKGKREKEKDVSDASLTVFRAKSSRENSGTIETGKPAGEKKLPANKSVLHFLSVQLERKTHVAL